MKLKSYGYVVALVAVAVVGCVDATRFTVRKYRDAGGDVDVGAGSVSGVGGNSRKETGSGGSGAGLGGAAGAIGSGGADAGGSSDAGPATATATLGEPCASEDAKACAGHAQKEVLTCKNGKWATGTPCSGTSDCDSTPGSAGSCQPIVTECENKQPGSKFCRSKERLECGPDLVNAISLQTCDFLCTSGACSGECTPDETDCRGGGDTGAGKVPRKCQTDGTWLDGPPCPNLCAAATGKCVAATCGDGMLNGDETDKDCGGGCGETCDVGQKCAADRDCLLPGSGKCTATKCAAADCKDGVKNGNETDVDCGGSCTAKCATTQHCGTAADCAASACVSGTCVGSCSPGTKQCVDNGVETCDSNGKWSAAVGCSEKESCRNGACEACSTGTANCNPSDGLGCETNLNANGTCGTTCANATACGANQACSAGACKCTGGLALCNSVCVNTAGADPKNCGACGHSCQSTAASACIAGVCQPIQLETIAQPVAFTANDTRIFWLGVDGYALTDSVNGGNRANFYVAGNPVSSSQFCPTPTTCKINMAIDATTVYWPAQTAAPPTPFVQAQTVGGNSPYAYGDSQDTNGAYTFVTVDATTIFATYTHYTVPGGICPSAGVDYMAITPRGRTVNHWGLSVFCRVNQMVSDGTNLYWTDLGSPNGSTAPGVFSAPETGNSSKLIDSASIPAGIAVYNGVLYWTDTGTGFVRRWPLTGTPSTLSTSTAPGPMAVDADGVYWIDSGKTILHAPLSGTNVTPQTLAASQVAATAIATNSTSVFWINTGTAGMSYADGAVMKIAK